MERDGDRLCDGLDVKPAEEAQLRGIAERGNGIYVSARDAASLKKVLAEVVVVARSEVVPRSPVGPYFFDDFNQNGLAPHWTIVNPNEDSYIAENGKLLVVAHDQGTLAGGSVPNLFVLNEPLPEGDWTMTARIRFQVQTLMESIAFGLYDDPKNYTLIKAWLHEGYGPYVYHSSTRNSNGKLSQNATEIWQAGHGKSYPNQIVLRVQKRGRQYHMASKFADDENPEKKFEWIEAGTVTSIRARGNLAIGAYQYGKVAGESTFEIDWVRIETAN